MTFKSLVVFIPVTQLQLFVISEPRVFARCRPVLPSFSVFTSKCDNPSCFFCFFLACPFPPTHTTCSRRGENEELTCCTTFYNTIAISLSCKCFLDVVRSSLKSPESWLECDSSAHKLQPCVCLLYVTCRTGNTSSCIFSAGSSQQPSDTIQTRSVPGLFVTSRCHNSFVVGLRFVSVPHALTVSQRLGSVNACEPWRLRAVTGRGSAVFHPHCAEWDVSSKCPHVSLMALPLW